MDKQRVVHLSNRIFFNHKKECSIDACYVLQHRRTNKTLWWVKVPEERSHVVWFHLYKLGKSIETVSRLVDVRGWGNREIGSNSLIFVGFSFLLMYLLWNWWWMHSLVKVLNVTEMYTSKWLILCYVNFLTIKKEVLFQSTHLWKECLSSESQSSPNMAVTVASTTTHTFSLGL